MAETLVEYLLKVNTQGAPESLNRVARGADDAADSIDRSGRKVSDAAEQFGDLSTIASGLGGGLGVASDKLDHFGLAMADTAGAVEALLFILTKLNPVTIAIGAVAATAGAALYYFSQQAEKAAQKTAEYQARVVTLTNALTNLKQIRADLAFGVGVATGEIGEGDAVMREASRLAQGDLQEAFNATQARLTQAQADLSKAQQKGGLDAIGAGSVAQAQVKAALADLERLGRERETLTVQYAESLFAQQGIGSGFEGAKQDQPAQGGAVEQMAREAESQAKFLENQQAEAQAAFRASLQTREELRRQLEGLQGEAGEMLAAIEAEVGLGLQDLIDALAGTSSDNLPIALETAAGYLEEYQTALEGTIKAEAEALKQQEEKARKAQEEADRLAQEAARARAERNQANASGVATALGVVGGNIGGALAGAGPWGAVLAAAMAIGEQGADGTREMFADFERVIIGFFEALPVILTEVIPDAIFSLLKNGGEALGEFIPALINALLVFSQEVSAQLLPWMITEFIPALVDGLINGITTAFGRDGRERRAERRWERDRGREGRLEELLGLDAGALGSTAEMPGFATGGFVSRTQIALVHEGERIIPATGAGSQRAMSMMGSPQVEINFPEWVRRLNSQLRQYGLNIRGV